MESWSGLSAAYRASFATLCAGTFSPILEDLCPDRLLDVGCGTGDLLAAAERRGFCCEGVDSDADMVAATRRSFSGRVRQAALPDLPFADESFDAVVANFVINHVADPRAAARELVRVTAPGGRVAVTIWPTGSAGWGPLVTEVFDEAGVVPRSGTRLPAHLDFPRSIEGLTDLMSHAGATVMKATQLEWVWGITPDNLWAGIEGGIAGLGQTYAAQNASVQAAAKEGFHSRAADRTIDGQLQFPNTAAYVLALPVTERTSRSSSRPS